MSYSIRSAQNFSSSDKIIRAHVFTNINPVLICRQLPRRNNTINGVKLSMGMDIPADVDVLLVYTRSSYSLQTRLPRERTVFLAGEPDVIHPYNTRFLNQFGIVVSSSEKKISTEKWHQSHPYGWFVGVDFSAARIEENLKGYDWFSALEPPTKRNKISIVTSTKSFTEFHRRRLKFIDEIRSLIPEHIELFGRGFRSIGDKADALLPYCYHLALENGGGPFSWTEKLSDPLLCWSFPFYAGCNNVEHDLPRDSFSYVDLDDAPGTAKMMVSCIRDQRWCAALEAIREARRRILHEHNLVFLFARLAKAAAAKPVSKWPVKQRLIRSERSLWPDKDGRGSAFQMMFRSTLLLLDPKIELRASVLQRWFEAQRVKRRNRRIAQQEEDFCG